MKTELTIDRSKLSDLDKEIHLVYITTGKISSIKEYEVFFDVAKRIIKQKMHFHLYIGETTKSKDYSEEFFRTYENYPNIKHFHIHRSINPKQLIDELRCYDFGLWLVFPKDNMKNEIETKLATGNKFATYLEAGLAFFCDTRLEYVCELMKKYNIYLPITHRGHNSIDNLRNRIKDEFKI